MKLAFEAYEEQVDKTGIPYIFHPLHLAEQMTSEATTVCALLHDVAEGTDYTIDDLKAMGFSTEVTDALSLLTHDKAIPCMDYVREIRSNPVVAAVKLADLRHDSDLSRLDVVDDKAIEQAEKYSQAIDILLGVEA